MFARNPQFNMKDKPKYDPQKHHRRSIRLKEYDYSQEGAYFVTICVKDMECLFGKIPDDQMHLNDAGLMIDKWWQKIPEKFPDIALGEYQVMPNHFHCIVINVGNNVGADPRVCPDDADLHGDVDLKTDLIKDRNENADDDHFLFGTDENMEEALLTWEGEHVGSPLHRVIQWFKTMSTNEYIRNVKQNGWPPFNGKLWQRNYYEHIIRNGKSYQNIANYIYSNPANWKKDQFYVGADPRVCPGEVD
jgi:REP element-mobilizing transposase RayT